MYGPTPGSSVRSCGQPSLRDERARLAQPQRAAVVAEADPFGSGRRRRAPPPASGPSASAPATPRSAGSRARPASAGASPPRRGSRRGPWSAATAGRGGWPRTSPAARRSRLAVEVADVLGALEHPVLVLDAGPARRPCRCPDRPSHWGAGRWRTSARAAAGRCRCGRGAHPPGPSGRTRAPSAPSARSPRACAGSRCPRARSATPLRRTRSGRGTAPAPAGCRRRWRRSASRRSRPRNIPAAEALRDRRRRSGNCGEAMLTRGMVEASHPPGRPGCDPAS